MELFTFYKNLVIIFFYFFYLFLLFFNFLFLFFRVRKGKNMDFYAKIKNNQELIRKRLEEQAVILKSASGELILEEDIKGKSFDSGEGRGSGEREKIKEGFLKCTHIKNDERKEYLIEKNSKKIGIFFFIEIFFIKLKQKINKKICFL